MVTVQLVLSVLGSFTPEAIAERTNKVIYRSIGDIEQLAKSSPIGRKMIKLVYVLLTEKQKTSPTAQRWAEEMEVIDPYMFDNAVGLVRRIRESVNNFFADIPEVLGEEFSTRLRPEMLGSIADWAEKNGEY